MKAVLKAWLIGSTLIASVLAADLMWGNGISGTGAVSRFKSVVLNGVHYDTSAAAIRLNGIVGSEADLRVGHQVVIETDGNSNMALVVNQYDALRGVVDFVAVEDATVGSSQISVLGQTVVSTADTIFHETDLESLQDGDIVAVGGFYDGFGNVVATSVERLTGLDETIVSGPVTAIDSLGFYISNVRVNAAHAQSYASEGWLALGQPVMAKGTFDGAALEADSVFPVNLHPVMTAEIFVDRALRESSGQFFVDGYRLIVTSETEFDNGTEAGLGDGVRVEVTGELLPGQLLLAAKIEFVTREVIRVDGEVEAVDHGALTMVTIAGVEASIDEDVVMLDRRDHYRHYSPDDIYVSDSVRAILESTSDGYRVRSLIRKPSVRRLLRAPVQDRSTWLARLTAADNDVDDLEDADEHTLDGQNVSVWELLQQLRDGDDVEVSWDFGGRLERVRGFRRYRSNDDDSDD